MRKPRGPLHCVLLAFGTLAPWLAGCSVGPSLLRLSRMQYNEAIQRTTDQQLLLNLVRLKYRDAPLFVEVGSVSAQFQVDKSAAISAQLNENVGSGSLNPDILRVDGRVGFLERPTITFTPLQGDEFVRRLLTPLNLQTIVLLSRSGWSIERVLRLCVEQMNNLDNASRASGPTPGTAPLYQDFVEASKLLRGLQLAGALEIGYAQGRKELFPPIDPGAVSVADLVTVAREGYAFHRLDDGRYALTGPAKTPVLRIAPDALDTDDGRRFGELLGLSPGTSEYALTIGMMRQPPDAKNAADRSKITLAPRSLMGVLFSLSHAIEVPEPHRRDRLVTITQDSSGGAFDWSDVTGDLLRVRSLRSAPRHAAVAVRYRGYWFYIDDADLNSKSTFSLLAQLFALQAGGAEGVVPVLTLPVG